MEQLIFELFFEECVQIRSTDLGKRCFLQRNHVTKDTVLEKHWCLENEYSDMNEVLGVVNEKGKHKSSEIRIGKCSCGHMCEGLEHHNKRFALFRRQIKVLAL